MRLPQHLLPPQVRWVWVHESDVERFITDNPEAAYCDFTYNTNRTMSALFKVVIGA